ncbi:MAG: hypothetical protein HY052_02870 [Proteobacteria bacterium]|nr:hypothetical protein [Pseudomonadota bacterium]
MQDFIGVHGHAEPFLNLEPYFDLTGFAAIHEEICYSLTQSEVSYTGGSHKSMGIVPPRFENDPFIDYGQVILRFTPEEFVQFMSLSDSEEEIDYRDRHKFTLYEEGAAPISPRQFLYLKYRYGVYFPWKVFLEFVEGNTSWDDKCTNNGNFFPEIETAFPLTVRFIRSLPFRSIGRCNLLGLEANDHATIHRDNYEKQDNPPINDFITLCPAGNKELFLWHDEKAEKLYISGRLFTFNDMNYHGVDSAPYFRYSIRVDGIFTDEFRTRISK